jgi:putative CocE/NonD family hydrolase
MGKSPKTADSGRPRSLLRSLIAAAGFLALAGAPPGVRADPATTEAGNPFEVQRSVQIPMRDGIRLSADVYVPRAQSGPFPVIMMRTPYSKNSKSGFIELFSKRFTQSGYVLVVEDKRGRFESEGRYIPADHEVADSYDSLEWISHQPWSNGKAGAYGCSDLGDATVYAAVSRHPSLKAIINEAGNSTGPAGDWYRYFGVRNGGAVELVMATGWMVDNGTKYFLRPPAGLPWEQFANIRPYYKLNLSPPEVNYDKALLHLPIIDIMRNIGLPYTDFENFVGRELTDPFFASTDLLKGDERIGVPVLNVNSWYDFGPGVTFWQTAFFERNAANETARRNQFLIMSPSLHCESMNMTANYTVGSRPMGDPSKDFASLYVHWFDHWLKGADNAVTSMPKIQYYMMGENKWRGAPSWPPPGAHPLRLYLGGTNSNGPAASGTLGSTAAPAGAPPHQYVYDPGHPAPSVGGSLCCIHNAALQGAYDQREVERRPDVLTYSTAPLKKGVYAAGPVDVVLHISSSAPDTDFTAKLVDVYPDGTAYNLQEGILRARYRDDFRKPALMHPGEVYQVRINLQDVGNYFGPGHRIRLEISSSNFPRFDRNLNTGGRNFDEKEWKLARNAVHIDAANPSYLELHVLDGRSEDK